jgi:hypothetical protein
MVQKAVCDALLRHLIGALVRYYDDPGVIEIMTNGPDEVFIDRFIGAARHDRNLNFVSQCYLARAEVLLSVAGLVDPAGEAAAAGTSARRKRPGLADVAKFLALRPTARKRAKRDCESYLDLTGSTGGPQYARCPIGLGLFAAARGQKAEAETRLSEGLVLAERFGLASLAYRTRHALSATDPARR